MGFSSIHYKGFRNIQDGILSFEGKEVFLIGENGQGKSNILESVYMLCFGSSFRGSHFSEIIKKGSDSLVIKGVFSNTAFPYPEKIIISYINEKKKYSINEKHNRHREELIFRHPCIVFCHEDMEFASGTLERKRWFFDQAICMTENTYIDILCMYKKILRTRNVLLKEKNYKILDVLDIQLVETGITLTRIRDKAVAEFNETFSQVFELVLGFPIGISIKYHPSWGFDFSIEQCHKFLYSKRKTDYAYFTTCTGPHRDKFIFQTKEGEYTKTASTGQNRLVALALRISEAIFLEKKTGQLPILLFDDVFLEIDPEKKRRLFRLLPSYDQAFFTFLPGEPYEAYLKKDSHIYFVKDGQYTN